MRDVARMAVAVLVLYTVHPRFAPGTLRSAALGNPAGLRNFSLQPAAIRGWPSGEVLVSRPEDNWHAWYDSHEAGRYFYHGPWRTLGRQSGWYERIKLTRGAVDADVVDLVSLFASAPSAEAAYRVMIRQAPNGVALPRVGSAAMTFSPSAGVASGPHLVLWSRSFDVYVQDGNMVAEVSAEESEKTGPGFQMPIPDASRAVARALVRAERHNGSVPRDAKDFPPSVYPKPAKIPPWGMMEGCASLSGVQVPGPGAARAAFPTLVGFAR